MNEFKLSPDCCSVHICTHALTHTAFALFYYILVAAALLGTVGKHICSVPTHKEG